MNRIKIADTTLCREDRSFSFKEKLEIIRQLDRMNCDTVELPEIENPRTDILMVRTASSFVKRSIISVAAGSTEESIENAAAALSAAEKARIRIALPTSSVGMEYFMRKKAAGMLEWITKAVTLAKTHVSDVEFCAVDATRSDFEFLTEAIRTAVEAGATGICVCDSAAGMLPDDFADFAAKIVEIAKVPVGVACSDLNGLAAAEAIMATRRGVVTVKTSVGGDSVPTETFASLIKNCGDTYGFECGISQTELHRIIDQIRRISGITVKYEKPAAAGAANEDNGITLDASDSVEAVYSAAAKLGYDLSDEDAKKVHEEVCRVAEKRCVGSAELEAIIASVALQVPDSYKLVSYVINNGNIINSSAQITLERDGKSLLGIAVGDGPVDAAFVAIEQIIGHRYELDDFRIQSVTEGKEAMGSALVKLRFEGKLYSGNGISTDVIGAGIRAYINAVNKIVYEEHND